VYHELPVARLSESLKQCPLLAEQSPLPLKSLVQFVTANNACFQESVPVPWDVRIRRRTMSTVEKTLLDCAPHHVGSIGSAHFIEYTLAMAGSRLKGDAKMKSDLLGPHSIRNALQNRNLAWCEWRHVSPGSRSVDSQSTKKMEKM